MVLHRRRGRAERHPGRQGHAQGRTPMTPEEKLLRAIFGEKASDVRDTSCVCRRSQRDRRRGAQVFSRRGVEKDERALQIELEAEIERLSPRTGTTMKAILAAQASTPVCAGKDPAGNHIAVERPQGLSSRETKVTDEGLLRLQLRPVAANFGSPSGRTAGRPTGRSAQPSSPRPRSTPCNKRFETRSKSCRQGRRPASRRHEDGQGLSSP